MDYEIRNKFSEALIYTDPPCAPIPTPVFLKHLADAAQFLFASERSRLVLRNRQMYIECFSSYLEAEGIPEIVPDELFFKKLAEDFKKKSVSRKIAEKRKTYVRITRKRYVNTIAFLINSYFYPRKITLRLIARPIFYERPYKTLKLPKLLEEFSNEKIIGLLREANKAVTTNKKIFWIRETHINIFEEYLKRNKVENLVPDELFLVEYYNALGRQPIEAVLKTSSLTPYYSDIVKERAVREIRILVNRYFLPQQITTRKILLEVEWQRYERFLGLTKKTQQAIAWFEDHGKRIKALPVYQEGNSGFNNGIRYVHQVTDKKLLPVTVYGKVNHVINFLNIVGKNGIEQIDDSDLKKFTEHCDKNKLSQKDDYLAHLATFFINVKAEGFISDHPFKHISLKMRGSNVRVDFISQEGIDSLFDLKAIDLKDPVHVRNVLACALAYDLGLRAGELYGLNTTDIAKDGHGNTYIALRPSIQKGHKPKTILYIYFEFTKAILKHYLGVSRPALKPKDNALFIAIHDKERLNKATLEDQIRQHLKNRGIKTFYGKNATGHHFRHSLATLNIEPLGACLPLNEIVERLRHVKYETARKHYIHSNPYLQKRKFDAIKNRLVKKTEREILQGIPLAALEAFLVEDLRIDPEFMKELRKRHRIYSLNNKDLPEKVEKDIIAPVETRSEGDKDKIATLSPDEVKKKIAPLGISIRSLTDYCQEKGLYITKGRDHYFVDSFIDEFVDEWIPKEEVMRTFNLHRRRFYRMLEERKWPTMKIGLVLFVRLKKLVLSARNINHEVLAEL